MNLDFALPTFLEECRELLQGMEESLLQLETDPTNQEAIASVFRAAHTVKGSAGLFGLDRIVAFTHVVENVLDRVREGELLIDERLGALLLQSGDYLTILLDNVHGELEEAQTTHGKELQEQLQAFLKKTEAESWHISLRFDLDIFRSGMDPASFLHYLETLGEITSLKTVWTLPGGAEMDPESCYLGVELRFQSEATKEAIFDVFAFIHENSLIHILPPSSKAADYISLIQLLPEDDLLLGEILVKIGTLTQAELEEGLALQRQVPLNEEGRPPYLGDILVTSQMVQQPVVEAALEKQVKAQETRNRDSKLIRVDSDKLDQLINLVGELVIAGANTSMIAGAAGITDLVESASVLTRLVEQVRDNVLQLRMVQIGATFSRFQRLARDVSQDLGKDIDLVISGGDTELDKSVVDKIGDPLTHLLRNAMDHGIERVEERKARGKSGKGTVKLNAYHDSGCIVIEVCDDGGGLNRDRLLKKGLEKGLVQPNQTLSDREVFNLIFEPGFSTADTISNLSGRGVGMDVVRRDITALRGTIEIESEEGIGSTFRIRLPLTLSIIDGFLVEIGNASYVAPLDLVVECVDLSELDRESLLERNYLNLRGEVLPFIRLRELFGQHNDKVRRENILVVRFGGKKAGLLVDELQGEIQTVIKPLGRIFERLRGIGGSTILGNGKVALILDVPALIERAISREYFQSSHV